MVVWVIGCYFCVGYVGMEAELRVGFVPEADIKDSYFQSCNKCI